MLILRGVGDVLEHLQRELRVYAMRELGPLDERDDLHEICARFSAVAMPRRRWLRSTPTSRFDFLEADGKP